MIEKVTYIARYEPWKACLFFFSTHVRFTQAYPKVSLKTKVLAFIPRSLKNGHFTQVGRPIGQKPLTMSYRDFDHPPRLSMITLDVYLMTILGILCVDI